MLEICLAHEISHGRQISFNVGLIIVDTHNGIVGDVKAVVLNVKNVKLLKTQIKF